jgi:hypothetical protein
LSRHTWAASGSRPQRRQSEAVAKTGGSLT